MSSPATLPSDTLPSATSLGERLLKPAALAAATVALTGIGAGAAMASPAAVASPNAHSASTANSTTSAITATLGLGSRGAAVTSVQKALTSQGHPVTADGVFGAGTERAVRAFQAKVGLSVDGRVGTATKAALGRATVASAPTRAAAPARAMTPAAGLGSATLGEGMHNAYVSTLQTLLNRGGAGLTVDGRFGPSTKAAVIAHQRAHSLAVDGRVGPATKASLQGASTPAPAAPAPSAAGLLKMGASGPAVSALQTTLNRFGAALTVDGDFGGATLAAVRAFQTANGLGTDGVVGPVTQAKLANPQSKRVTEARAATAPAPRAQAPDATRQAVLDKARSLLGIYYIWGGSTPAGFDCSGYTQFVYRAAGIDIPRVSDAQVAAGRVIPRSQAKPGDLVAIGAPGNWHHIGIYTGGNTMMDSGKPGIPTQERNIWTSNVIFITYL